MSPAVFGDFLSAADQCLESAVLAGGQPPARLPSITRSLRRLVMVMSRYGDDLAPCDEIQARSRNDLRPWERAAIDAGTALHLAADCLRRADEAASDQIAAPSRQARLLETAATELTAGRDLLQTHRATDPAGLAGSRSEWAAVVTSLPITRALMSEIARLSRRLAPFTAQLASSAISYAGPLGLSDDLLTALHAELSNAIQSLQAAGAAVRQAIEIEPVRTADTELMHAIPTAMVPSRHQPGTTAEPVSELCRGIAVSASRLRSGVQGSKERARWSPGATSRGWQWMAQAAAVTGQLAEIVLRSLATRASALPDAAVYETQLYAAADLVAGMRAAWHEVDRRWDAMMTESRLLSATGLADASDLVLRIGRLTWDDPHWTPAHSHRAPPMPSAALAPDADAVKAVLAAVHQAVDAMAVVAWADGDAVRTASAGGRLYVPTRTLPARYDVPRPFAPAPVSRRQALCKAYDSALDASYSAAGALGELAVAAGAPSRVLAFARAAALVQSNRRGRPSRPDTGISRSLLPARAPFGDARATTGQAGPVEQTIRDRGISDPIILLRAAAIDNAASRLITEAGSRARAAPMGDTRKNEQHPVRSEVELAAQSFPHGRVARPPTLQSPPSTEGSTQTASSKPRLPRPALGSP